MIVFCTTESEAGGVARVQQHIREYLKKNHEDFKELQYNPDGIRLLNKVRFVSELMMLARNADTIIFSHPHLYKAIASSHSVKANKIVFTHGLELYQAGASGVYELLSSADVVITNSVYNTNWLQLKARLRNVEQVYYPGLRFALVNVPKEPNVLTVGRMMKSENYKGHINLLRAWQKVVKKISDAKLVFCGYGDQLSDLVALADLLGISKNVIFTGFVSDLKLIEWYSKAALFAMPSKGEGQGLVWLEAMQAGLPVIALAGTVAEEFITEKNGVLLKPDFSEQDLADVLIKGLQDRDWRKKVANFNKKEYERLNIFHEFQEKLKSLTVTS